MLTLFLMTCGLSFVTRAERPYPPRTGNIELGATYSYFSSSANYDLNSSSFGIANNGGISTKSGTLAGSYDYNRRIRGLLAVEYTDAATTDGFFDRDTGSLTYVDVGAQYYLSAAQFLLIPQVDAKIPTTHVDETSDNAIPAEGVFTARASGWAIWRLGEFQPFAYVGGEYRDGQRSSLFDYEAGVHFREDVFFAQAELRGFVSVTSDADTNTTGRVRRLTYLQKVNGGSFRFYAPNPSLHEAALEVGYSLDTFKFFAGASTTIAGTDAASGWGAWGGVRWTIPTASNRSRVDSTDSSGFEPNQDPYDADVFSDHPTVKRSYPLRPRPAPRPAGSDAKTKQQQNLNKLLNETEKDLEN